MHKAVRRLGRWLPDDAARDLFEPSLHDLEGDWARDRLHGGPLARCLATVRFTVAACVLYLQCLRLVFVIMMIRDLRHALRLFRREPAFASAAVLTLALGIGANTALFAVVEAVLLRPLPYPDSSSIVMLRHRDLRTGISKDFVALGDVIDLRARQRELDVLAAFNNFQSTLLNEGDALRLQGLSATPELFKALRLQPVMGRFFDDSDLATGAAQAVIISHELWTTRFGTDATIAGRSIQVGNNRRLIVGVAPPGFQFPPGRTTDIIVPFQLPAAAPAERRAWIHAMGRLRAGGSMAAANAEIVALSSQLEQEFPASNLGTQYDLMTARDWMVGDTKRPLLLLLGAVGFVLLIACANVGNLLLAQSLARQQEMATRLALGAGRGRLASQVFTEGLVLALAGGLAGVLVAWQAAPALAALVPQDTPIPSLDAVSLNPQVLIFSLLTSLLAAVIFSAVAVLGVSSPTAAMLASRRVTMTASAKRAASALVVAEVALAIVLLIGAGLTLRSFANLIAVDPGFDATNVLNVQIGLPPGRYVDANARRAFYNTAFAAIEALPEVETVGAAVVTPLTGNNWTIGFQRSDRQLAAGERAADVGWQGATGSYFTALRIPLRAGRLFDGRDASGGPVVIISEGIASRFFPNEPAVGRRVRLGKDDAEIIGVVGDIRRAALSDRLREDMYLPLERDPGNGVGLFIRTSGDPLAALPSIRQTLRTLEPNAVLYGSTSLEDVAAESAAIARLAMRLLAGFAGIALALSAIGIYGVMSYAVRRRVRELGTRLALGATRGDIVSLVLRQAAVVAGIGIAIGLGTGLAAAQWLHAILFGVAPWDPLAIAAAVLILAVTALAASYLPARRASQIDPARTLAGE